MIKKGEMIIPHRCLRPGHPPAPLAAVLLSTGLNSVAGFLVLLNALLDVVYGVVLDVLPVDQQSLLLAVLISSEGVADFVEDLFCPKMALRLDFLKLALGD
jgi:hypothetical protein